MSPPPVPAEPAAHAAGTKNLSATAGKIATPPATTDFLNIARKNSDLFMPTLHETSSCRMPDCSLVFSNIEYYPATGEPPVPQQLLPAPPSGAQPTGREHVVV